MRIADHHIAALQALGYTETEARFLYIVATHSGYFTLHQFLTFSRVRWGKRCTKFGLKLEGHGHACWREYAGVGRVYHLFSKLRNRRRHAREFVLTRLVLLDFVLENQQHDYLESEQAKVAYFCEQLGLPRQTLPVKAYHGSSRPEPTLRYFVDKYPLFFASDACSSPVVTFSYVDPGYAGIAGFANHLSAYTPLLRSLPRFRFLYIANSAANFKRAEERFSGLIQAPFQADVSTEVLRYFQLRKAWEMKRYGLFSNDEIASLNEGTRRFQGDTFEMLYCDWLTGKITAEAVRRGLTPATPQRGVEFATYLVGENRLPVGREKAVGAEGFTQLLHRENSFASPPRCSELSKTEGDGPRGEESARRGQIRMRRERPHPWTHCAPLKLWGRSRLCHASGHDTFGRALKQNPGNNKETTGRRNAIHQKTTRSR